MMNSTNPNTAWKVIAFSMIAMAFGVLVGVAGTRYADRAWHPTEKPHSDAALDQPGEMNRTPIAKNNHWDFSQELHNIRLEMDRLFDRSLDRLRTHPELSSSVPAAGYSSSLEVRDLKDHYEIRADLPDTKASEAQVQLDGNELKVEVTQKATETEKEKNAAAELTEWGRYDQMVELPGKVQSDKMKVKRTDHELLITVPKAA